MTTPDERTRAVLATRDFLQALTDPRRTPRTPSSVREMARVLLRHYPGHWHLDVAAMAWPSAWGAVGSGHKDAPTYLELLERLRERGPENLPPPTAPQGPA